MRASVNDLRHRQSDGDWGETPLLSPADPDRRRLACNTIIIFSFKCRRAAFDPGFHSPAGIGFETASLRSFGPAPSASHLHPLRGFRQTPSVYEPGGR